MLTLTLNGGARTLETLESPAPLLDVVQSLELKPDRIAIEHNGELAPRRSWPAVVVTSGDKLEIVHFVGGGLDCQSLNLNYT